MKLIRIEDFFKGVRELIPHIYRRPIPLHPSPWPKATGFLQDPVNPTPSQPFTMKGADPLPKKNARSAVDSCLLIFERSHTFNSRRIPPLEPARNGHCPWHPSFRPSRPAWGTKKGLRTMDEQGQDKRHRFERLATKVKPRVAAAAFDLAAALNIHPSKWIQWAIEAAIAEQRRDGVDAWVRRHRGGQS